MTPSSGEVKLRLAKIERTLNTLEEHDPAAVVFVATIFADMVREENERTVLLQQRASSLLSSSMLAVSIILASIGLMFKDVKERSVRRNLSILVLFILFILGISLYWTWDGFGTRPFVTFNTDNLLENMAKPGADLLTSKVVAVQQKYQVVEINGRLNTEKARSLQWATVGLFLGLFLFSAFCLSLLMIVHKPTSDEEEMLMATNTSQKKPARPTVTPGQTKPAPKLDHPKNSPEPIPKKDTPDLTDKGRQDR